MVGWLIVGGLGGAGGGGGRLSGGLLPLSNFGPGAEKIELVLYVASSSRFLAPS